MTKTDRRARRTRQLLQRALIELIGERRYDAITIQDIADRADVGRTTFYLHFGNKDELFVSCHEAIVGRFGFGPRHPLSRDELLASEAPPGMTAAYRHLEHVRGLLPPIFQGKDGPPILRRIRDRSAQEIEASLRAAFPGADSAIPLDVLATYLAGAQIALVHWWLEDLRPHSPETLARAFHGLQRAAILDAFGPRDEEQARLRR